MATNSLRARWLAVWILAAGFAVSSQASRAEDPAPPPEAPAPAPAAAAAEPPKKKEPFFGDRFALYLETRGGPASMDAIENPVTTGVQLSTSNELKFDGNI